MTSSSHHNKRDNVSVFSIACFDNTGNSYQLVTYLCSQVKSYLCSLQTLKHSAFATVIQALS